MITRPRFHVSTLIFENSSFPDLIPARSETVTPSGRHGLFFSRGDRSNPQLILVLFPPLRLGDVSSIRGIKTGQFHVSPRLAKLTYAGRSSSALQPRLTLSLLLKMKFSLDLSEKVRSAACRSRDLRDQISRNESFTSEGIRG